MDHTSLPRDSFAKALERFEVLRCLPYEEKVAWTWDFVEDAIRRYKGRVGVSCSFGKDSMVVTYLAREVDPDIPIFWANTGVEFRETVRFAREVEKEWNLNLIECKPIKHFWRCVKEYGFPWPRRAYKYNASKMGSGSPRCCYYMKERPLQIAMMDKGVEASFLGLNWNESYQRCLTIIKYGPEYYNKTFRYWKLLPIAYWTEEEVWRFTRERGIPVNPRYGMGERRIGCLTCTGYLGGRKDMARHHPRLFVAVLKMMREMGDPRGIQAAQEEYGGGIL